ncbi:MAG: GNAT family N-acetyltransferase [Phycisphaerae bacterium]|nr:GNAT family N-acetyltransferase [Phycisphaerae bacterium]
MKPALTRDDITLAPYQTDRDHDAVTRMLQHAFAGDREGIEGWMKIGGEANFRTLLDSSRPAATLLRIPMGQYFGGRSVKMLGIAGVAVAPEDRGRGYAKRMMRACVQAAHEESWPLVGLYASTHSLYRAVGFEHAGHRFQYTIPMTQIDAGPHDRERVEPLDPDSTELRECYAGFAARYDGMLDRGAYIWQRVKSPRNEEHHPFGVRDEHGTLQGYVFVNQKRRPDGRADVNLSDFVFHTPAAGRRLWALLADYSMMSHDLVFFGGPTHPALLLLSQQRYSVENKDSWLIRVSHMKAALEARGYAPCVRTQVHLDVSDDLVPANAGRWTLSIENGQGRAEPGGRGEIRVDARGLAAIYAGFLTPSQAASVGLASGDHAALHAANSAFAGGTPWMNDFF